MIRTSSMTYKLPCLVLSFALFSGALLYAEESGPQVIQRLSWPSSSLVSRYEVILEEERDGRYGELLRQSTRENVLDVSVRPGRYRYAVRVYNLLQQLEYTMDWVYFTISDLKPVIDSFTPEAFFQASSPRQITITGQNIDPKALIILRPRNAPGEGIRPKSTVIEENGSLARLTFDTAQPPPGSYNVYIMNPGGQEDSRGTFVVHPPGVEEIVEESVEEITTVTGEGEAPEPSKGPSPWPAIDVSEAAETGEDEAPEPSKGPFSWPAIDVSAGYAPLVPLYGVLFIADAFEGPFFPLGFTARLGALPLRRNWGDLGAEAKVSWNYLNEAKERYTVTAQLIGVQLGLRYQRFLPNRTMAFNFHLGAGVTILAGFQFDYGEGGDPPLTGMYLSLDTGLSFRWYIKGRFFIDVGADFTHVLTAGDPSQPGYLHPALSFGWQF
jgi:hypothetical protein